ncbi:MAG: M1 family metallopeptidase [Saprospiraceae bacterium]
MKKQLTFLLLFAISITAFAQEKPYFQQDVAYKMDVTLNDVKHEVYGDIAITYKNNSPDALDKIYMHLWPNAYQNGTALANQFLRNKETKMYYAENDKLGKITNLDFKVDDAKVTWIYDAKHKDIAILTLAKPLQPGGTIVISTPFLVDIPASFSRLGHVGESYQMTQWYPKPAVYDRFGWHPMPYLNMGEFFSEFGSFDVKITLPNNYVVGATGVLQNKEEIEFLKEKTNWTNEIIDDEAFGKSTKNDSFPPSSNELKTIQYKAENVHDFAWFADKRFYVQNSQVTLKSGAKVDTWAMYTDYEASIWTKAIEYVNRSVLYYSERVGEYPYPHATAVQSALSAGGGMEYPMITVIGPSGTGKSLDNVITHEVGHNWFYGILGSNERDYPWMDEGMNSYYESDYMEKYYGKGGLDIGIPDQALGLLDAKELDLEQTAYVWQARQMNNQPMNTTSDELTMINYQLSAYSIPSMMFKYLEMYLGTKEFNKIAQKYYDDWKFKHPYPADVKAHFEKESGKDLGWFFDEFFNTRKSIDYALGSVQVDGNTAKISVSNRGDIASPVAISVVKDSTISTHWFDGFEGKTTLEVPAIEGATYAIDNDGDMLEINRRNNFQKTPVKAKFLIGLENPKKKTVYFAPTLGYNAYDGFMLGLGFYNRVFPTRKFEFAFTPMYGFNSGTVVGLADFKYHINSENGIFRTTTLGLNVRSFNQRKNEDAGYHLRYTIFKPSVRFELKRQDISPTKQFITLSYRNMAQEGATFDSTGTFVGKGTGVRDVIEGRYELTRNTAFSKSSITFSTIRDSYSKLGANNTVIPVNLVRSTLEATHSIKYRKNKRKSFDIRLFVGGFLSHDDRDFGALPLSLVSQGYNDYYYDNFYFGRTEQTGFLAQQISLDQGGFKMPVPRGTQNGSTNSFLFAMNLKTDLPMNLPLNLPLKPYLDIGYFNETAPSVTNPTEFFVSGGVALDFFDGILGIYFPLFGTDAYMNQQPNFGSRISFNLDLNRLNGFEALRNISM